MTRYIPSSSIWIRICDRSCMMIMAFKVSGYIRSPVKQCSSLQDVPIRSVI